MKVSIISLAWNHCDDVTKPFIKNLFENTKGVEFELIMVNNGSVDNTLAVLDNAKKLHENMVVIHNKTNLGFSGGCNVGFRKAKGEYVLFLNNDVKITDKYWLKNLLGEAEQFPDTLLGAMLVDFNHATIFRDEITPYLNGWCVFAKKEIFEKIAEDGQVFDEGVGLAYFEDTLLSARAVQMGYKLKEVKNLGLIHYGSLSSDKLDKSEATRKAQRHFFNRMQMMYLEKAGKKRIVFYYRSAYGFTDEDYEGVGVGGSEAALILLAREFAKNGWQTEVYNITKKTGIFNGVEYRNISEYRPTDFADVFVLFRNPFEYLPYVNAINKVFWSCDQYTVGNWKREVFPFVDKVVAISPYHAGYVENRYGPVKEKTEIIELGVNKSDYEVKAEKIPGKIIYCSVPRRGLEHLANYWKQIKAQVPGATLVITSDYRLWGLEEPSNREFIEMFKSMPGVEFLGKIPRKELVYHQKTSEIMAYPCTYEECFCISAMECIAAGAVPVTTKIGALATTVGDNGVLLEKMPSINTYDGEFITAVSSLLTNREQVKKLRERGVKRALTEYTYEAVYSKWEKMLNDLVNKLKGGENMSKPVCKTCGKEMPNSYTLAKHEAKHTNATTDVPVVITPQRPDVQVLTFNVPIDVQINGKKYEGTRVEVEYDRVSAVTETVRNAYGPEAIAS